MLLIQGNISAFGERQVGVAQNPHQQVVEVVGDPPGQDPQALQLLGVLDPRLQRPAFLLRALAQGGEHERLIKYLLNKAKPASGEAFGSDDEIMRLADDQTRVINLEQRTVIPGLNDSHTHVIRGGLHYNMELRWEVVPSVADALRMIKRRARHAGLPNRVCCHTFRATGITAYLESGGSLEHAQRIAAHSSVRTTKLYERTSDAVSLDEIERIQI